MLKLMNLSLIPTLKFDPNHKCEIFLKSELAKISFHLVEMNITSLELIQNNICDLKFVQTKGRKKYFIIFIDNRT